MATNFTGIIIRESLSKNDVLEKVKILKTKVEKVGPKHKTPWLKKWTMLTVEIGADKAAKVADELSKSLAAEHNWYADFKNSSFHFIIFRNKIFRIDLEHKVQYEEAKKYGLSQGIPAYQLDFEKN